MKLFSVDEANQMLAEVAPKLRKIRGLYQHIDVFRDASRAAARASESGGGMRRGGAYVKSLYEIGKLTTDLHESGVLLKDYSQGLIDFPTMRDGRVVLLCWRLGEDEKIDWWHEAEAGFSGRQPL